MLLEKMMMTQVLNDRFAVGRWRLGVLIALVLVSTAAARAEDGTTWRAGVGKVNITPDEAMWMSGYAAQVWKLGQEQLWISLSGEVVVDYSLIYKAKYGPQTWVNGFAHDLVCYIPSSRILREGGGQEVGIPWSYGLSALEWADDIEDRIHASVGRLVDRVK